MFLERLTISNRSTLIREVNFHKGINFIVDETPSEISTPQATGNNVGKSTVLRLVDYCFGADGKSIYQDTEFNKQPNTTVEKFLKENEIVISLTLIRDIENENSERVVIKRNFLSRKNKLQQINGENIIDPKSFDLKLKETIFHSKVDKPTFRQIISKNIRDEKNKMTNIVKVLNSFATYEVYEALYLFWLGISTDSLEGKQRLSDEKKKEENFQKRLRREGELSLIDQQISFLNDKIEELDIRKNSFNLNPNYSLDIDRLNQIKYSLNKTSTELSRLEVRRDLIIESKSSLEQEYTKIDTGQILSLYQRAQSLIPNIQVSFEDTVKFHNELISEKLEYITKELPELDRLIVKSKSEISSLRTQEDRLTDILHKTGVTEDLERIVVELNKLFERKGTLEEQKRLWLASDENLRRIESELNSINEGILSEDQLIQSRIREFNKYFSEMSNRLYGEYYLLSSQKNEKGYDLIVTNVEGNPSTGKKKGQIAAFDFAYIQFAEALDIECLHFIMHDQIENIHDNQITTIFEVANSINAQFIVPILRDKIPSNIDIEQFEILSLSQADKLFRIE
ncbi:MAG: DUF2326 domain-containing protein [Cyclobacteriaceae bacterium]